MPYIFRTAFRYLLSKEKGVRKTTVYIVLGITAALASFLTILALMRAMRGGNLKAIREIQSFDIVLKDSSLTPLEIEGIPGVVKAFHFKDYDVLFSKGESPFLIDEPSSFIPGRIRAIDVSAYRSSDEIDFAMISPSVQGKPSGGFGGFIPSFALSSALYLYSGEETEVMFLKEGRTRLATPFFVRFTPSGFYRSTYPDFDSRYAFIGLDTAEELLGENNFDIGILCAGGYKNADKVSKAISSMDPGCSTTTFIQANKTLYSALMLESRVIYSFLFLVSLVVLLQLKSATSRIISIKRKDAGILRVLGFNRRRVRAVFVLYGMIMLVFSEILAVAISFLICANVDSVFRLMDFFFSMFGRRLFLSSMALEMNVSWTETLVTCVLTMIFGFLFILSGCRTVFRRDPVRVVMDASY